MRVPISKFNQATLSGRAIALLFVVAFVLAALLAYYSNPSGGGSVMGGGGVMKAPDDEKVETEIEHTEDGDVEIHLKGSNRTQEELEHAIIKDKEKVLVVQGQHEVGESDDDDDEEEPSGKDGESSQTSGQTPPPSGPAVYDDEVQSEAPLPTDNYEVTDEDCKTSQKTRKIGQFGGPRLQYVHVPKTGGTSVQVAMVGWAIHANKKTFLLKENSPMVRGRSENCPYGYADATILIGHRGFGFCKDVAESPRSLFTFATLRKSASRMVSLVDYNLNRLEPRSLRLYGSESLNTLIKRYNATPEVEEGESLLKFSGSQQIRFLCGYECLGPNAWNNVSYTVPYMLERAKENVRKLDIIGLTEELNECIKQIRFHLTLHRASFHRWPEANEIQRRKKSVLDEQSWAILEEWGRPDQELYDYAKTVYLRKQAIAAYCLKNKLVPEVKQ